MADMRHTTDVPCPRCGAAQGEPCVTPSRVVRALPHNARRATLDFANAKTQAIAALAVSEDDQG